MTEYHPAPIPRNPDELIRYLESELFALKTVIDALIAGHLDQTNVAPTKPRNGDIRYADGTNFNPGNGQGIYYYNGTSWIPLINSTMLAADTWDG